MVYVISYLKHKIVIVEILWKNVSFICLYTTENEINTVYSFIMNYVTFYVYTLLSPLQHVSAIVTSQEDYDRFS